MREAGKQEVRRGRSERVGHFGKEEKTTSPKLVALAPSQSVCTHKHYCSGEPAAAAAAARQDRQPPVERRPGQGRAGQGRVRRLVVVVVVVVAASETVRLSRLRVLTVDSLSTVDLTSQGFFYIPACACVHLCVGACTKKKEREKFVC